MSGVEVLGAALDIDDPGGMAAEMAEQIRRDCRRWGRRRAVVAVSGGIDSAVCLALATTGLGPERVDALYLPDRDSSPTSVGFAQEVAASCGIPLVVKDITPVLNTLGCYDELNLLAAESFGGFDASSDGIRTEFAVDLERPDALSTYEIVHVRDGNEVARQPVGDLLLRRLLAATNLKQRVRMLCTYQAAEMGRGVVINTTNRQELLQGFFVKYGDGAGDSAPLHSLYKAQVRRLGAALAVPPSVQARTSTTDTYSAQQSQAQFFFGMPERVADAALAAVELGIQPRDLATFIERSEVYAVGAIRLIQRRLRLSTYNRSFLNQTGAGP